MLIGYMRVSTDNAKKPAVWAWNPNMKYDTGVRPRLG